MGMGATYRIVERGYAAFGTESDDAAAEYASWVRSVAEARLAESEGEELPWWESARHVDEIAGPELCPEARTFDGLALIEERRKLTFEGFVRRSLKTSGHHLDDLSSRHRGSRLIDGRIEFITLGLSRYSLRARDFATLLDKHGATVTRWLSQGLRRERDDPTFQQRLDDRDRAISDDRHNATMRNVAP